MSLKSNEKYIGPRTTIEYDFNYNPYPADVVSELFDTYEDAKIIAEEKNDEIKHNIATKIYFSISDPRFKETLSEYEHEFTEELSICQLFEKLALAKTEDMIITDEINTNKELQLVKTKSCQ